MDIKKQMALDMASHIGAVLLDERCTKCVWPLMMVPVQDMPFCGNCADKRRQAQCAHALMVRVKLAEKGIYIGEESASYGRVAA